MNSTTAISMVRSGRGVSLLLLTLAAASATYARAVLSPLQEAMRLGLSLTDTQMALLQGPALAAPLVLGAMPLGLLIDRHSRVRLLFVLAVIGTLGNFLSATASGVPELFIARCLIGLTAAGTAMAVSSLIADLFPSDQRGRAIMVVGIGQVAGPSAAFAVGGVLLSMYSADSEGWRHVMMLLTVPLIPVLVLVLAMHEPPRMGLAIHNPSMKQTFVEFWKYRRVIAPLFVSGAMVGITDGAALIWAAPVFSRHFALAPERIGAIMATVLLVSGILGPIAGGFTADLCHRLGGPRRTVSVVGLITFLSVPAGLFAVAPSVEWAAVLLALLITVGTIIGVSFTALGTLVIPNELRGFSMGISAAAGTIFGVGLAPMTASFLSTALGGPAMLGKALAIVCVSTTLVAAIVLALGRRDFPAHDRSRAFSVLRV